MDDFQNDDIAEIADGCARDNARLELSESGDALNRARTAFTALLDTVRQSPEYAEAVRLYYIQVSRHYRARQQAKKIGLF